MKRRNPYELGRYHALMGKPKWCHKPRTRTYWYCGGLGIRNEHKNVRYERGYLDGLQEKKG